jgi:hypothetical protein
MNGSHCSEEQFDGYVSDVLDADARVLLEAHVSACEPCERELGRHARAEEAMHEVARSSRVAHLGTAVMRCSAAAAALLAVAGLGWALHSRAPIGAGELVDGIRADGDAGAAAPLDLAPDNE